MSLRKLSPKWPRHERRSKRRLFTGQRIFVVRHGETDFNAARIIQKPTAPLSERGRRQAAQLAARLADVGITRILSSDFPRAFDTATTVAERLGIDVEREPLLRERDFGDFCGRSYDSLPFNPLPLDFSPPNGEDSETFAGRVSEAWQRVTRSVQNTPGNLLVVTHGVVCRGLVLNHVQIAPGTDIPSSWFNTSVTEVDAAAPWQARRLNCVAHLEN